MSDDDDTKVIVDTKEHLVMCEKLKQSLLIPLKNCEQCDHHVEIIELFPGTVTKTGNDNVVLREDKIVKASEMTLGPVENDLPPSYRLMCGLPRIVQVVYMGEIVEG